MLLIVKNQMKIINFLRMNLLGPIGTQEESEVL